MTDIVQRFQHRKVRVVPGGSTRHRSIRNGVLALGEGEAEEESPAADGPKVVIIHDAVRPFVEEEFLYKIAAAAKEHGVSTIPAVLTETSARSFASWNPTDIIWTCFFLLYSLLWSSENICTHYMNDETIY